MYPILKSQLKLSLKFQKKCLSSLSFSRFGLPADVLRLSEPPSYSNQLDSNQVRINLEGSPITTEDIRSIRGVSAVHSACGVAGVFGLGKVADAGVKAQAKHVIGESVFMIAEAGKGTWGKSAVVCANRVHTVPVLSLEQGAMLPVAASAVAILKNFTSLKSGDVVLLDKNSSPLNFAIEKIGKKLGLNIVSVQPNQLSNAETKSKIQQLGPVRLAITSETGKNAIYFIKSLADKGVLVCHNASSSDLLSSESLDLPASNLIFNDATVAGFDFSSWAIHKPTECASAIKEAANYLQSGDLAFDTVAFKVPDFLEALKSSASGIPAVFKL